MRPEIALRTAAGVGEGPIAVAMGEMIFRKCGKSAVFAAEQRTMVNVSRSCFRPGSVTVHGTLNETCKFCRWMGGAREGEGGCRIKRQGEPLESFASR
jgi:hypothetical protein